MSKVYKIVTDKIIEDMQDTNTLPWRRSWHGINSYPTSGNSGKQYRGANVFLLAMMQKTQPNWYTYNQIKKIAEKEKTELSVKGKKSMPICFFKFNKSVDKKTGKEKTWPMLRYYGVFNAEDIDGLPESYLQKAKKFAHNPIANCEQILATMENKPVVDHGGNRACYLPTTDVIKMPEKTAFETSSEYYSTLFHEMIHWTGKQLGRDMSGNFGNESYSTEELIAEFGAAMLCGLCGIDNTIENSTAYIKGWAAKFKADDKLIVQAAAKAQKAVDMIMGTVFENVE